MFDDESIVGDEYSEGSSDVCVTNESETGILLQSHCCWSALIICFSFTKPLVVHEACSKTNGPSTSDKNGTRIRNAQIIESSTHMLHNHAAPHWSLVSYAEILKHDDGIRKPLRSKYFAVGATSSCTDRADRYRFRNRRIVRLFAARTSWTTTTVVQVRVQIVCTCVRAWSRWSTRTVTAMTAGQQGDTSAAVALVVVRMGNTPAAAERRQKCRGGGDNAAVCHRSLTSPRVPRPRRRRPRVTFGRVVGGERGACCVSVRARASLYEWTPVALGRSSRPFNRSPLVNRWPGGKPTAVRVGGPAGRPYDHHRHR